MFDINLVKRRKAKAKSFIQNSDFYQFIYQDIIHRLSFLKNSFQNILINSDKEELCLSMFDIAKKFPGAKIKFKSIDEIDESELNSFDLIIDVYNLHWELGIGLKLKKIHNLLAKQGLYIGNFAGGGSLANLRSEIMQLEEQQNLPHAAHISPFIRYEDMPAIFKKCGFNESIIDNEKIELEFDNALGMMRFIKSVGESNALIKRAGYSINKQMYENLQKQAQNSFIDKINLISFIAAKNKHSILL